MGGEGVERLVLELAAPGESLAVTAGHGFR